MEYKVPWLLAVKAPLFFIMESFKEINDHKNQYITNSYAE